MDPIITGRGIEITEAIKQKCREMLNKHKKILEKINKVEIVITDMENRKSGVSEVRVEITVTMPHALVRVEESGEDFYATIDKIDPVLRRRLLRYKDSQKRLKGKESWKTREIEQFHEEMKELGKKSIDIDVQADPVITRHKKFSQNSPMHPAEAIERMELLGHEAFLFKNIESGKYTMVYRKRDGTYGLVEPKDA